MERTWQQPGTYTRTGDAMKAVGQARPELSGVSRPDHLWPPVALYGDMASTLTALLRSVPIYPHICAKPITELRSMQLSKH